MAWRSWRFPITAVAVTTALLLGACDTAPVAVVAPAAPSDADRAYQAVQELAYRQQHTPREARENPPAYLGQLQATARTLHDDGLAFIERHPTDPRRWDVLTLLENGPYYRVSVGPGGEPTFVIDRQASAAWDQEYLRRLQLLLAAPDSRSTAREAAYRTLIYTRVRELMHQPVATARPQIAQLRHWLESFEAEGLQPGALPSLYLSVADVLEYAQPEACVPFLEDGIARHPGELPYDRRLRERLQGRERYLRGKTEPVDGLWTQLGEYDAGLADPARFRGKVVLVAICPVGWVNEEARLAGWFRKYHAAGLEIVQVTGPNNATQAPPEQKHRAAMEAYVASKQLPWRFVWVTSEPVDTVAKYWGVPPIPSWLLVGRDGRFICNRGVPRPFDAVLADVLGGK